jgi:hypothetical protein
MPLPSYTSSLVQGEVIWQISCQNEVIAAALRSKSSICGSTLLDPSRKLWVYIPIPCNCIIDGGEALEKTKKILGWKSFIPKCYASILVIGDNSVTILKFILFSFLMEERSWVLGLQVL